MAHALKRLGRYLLGEPRKVLEYDFQTVPDEVTIWTDSDFAGCGDSRKSTSGGVAMVGECCIKSWSSTQDVIALSSGEAEFYAIVRGCCQGLGAQSMLRDLGVEVHVRVNTDASAARGICMRRGLGKVRHIEVNQLWVQEAIASGRISLDKVGTSDNLADVLTKHLAKEQLVLLTGRIGLRSAAGRHPLAPDV